MRCASSRSCRKVNERHRTYLIQVNVWHRSLHHTLKQGSGQAKEKPMEGTVIAVGPGAWGEDGKTHPLDVKAGDQVLFGKWSGTEVNLDAH